MNAIRWSLDSNHTYRSLMKNHFAAFADSVLRGVGQVMFQNNPITGLIFLIGIFYNSWVFGLYAILATVVATLTAMVMGAPAPLVRAGLFGFNGTLLGIAFAFFLQPDPALLLYTVAGAIGSTVVMAALLNLLGTWDVPPLTAPFVLTTWFFLFAFYLFSALHGTTSLGQPSFPIQIATTGTVTASTFYVGFLKGIGAVFFQDNLITGLIFLFGLFVNSRFSALFAGLASLIALLAAWALGASESTMALGLFGFSAVLTGIALGGTFFVLTWWSALYTVFGIIVTAVVFGTISVALTPLGMPALTAPFVVTTWFFVFAKAIFGRLQAVPLADITSAEGNRQWFKEHQARVSPPPGAEEPSAPREQPETATPRAPGRRGRRAA
jgi:urea transporter